MAAKKKSARDMFKGQDAKAQQEQFEKAQAEVGSQDSQIKLRDGMNILWLVPRIGSMPNVIEMVKLHHRPMHVCGRMGRVKDIITGEIVEDGDFKNCPRCLGAWDFWKAAGLPGKKDAENQNPYKDVFKKNMPDDFGLIQAVDFTPFFMMDGRNPVFNEKTAEYLEPFIRALGGDKDALAELPDEEMRKVAKAGISPVKCASTKAATLPAFMDRAEKDATDNVLKRAKKDKRLEQYTDGVVMHPEAFLMYIEKGKDKNNPFPGSDGQDRYPNTYVVKYLTMDDLEDTWLPHLPVDDLFDAAVATAIDLHDPDASLPDDADLKTRANSFAKLSHSEILEYLDECGHKFAIETGEESSSGGGGSASSEGPGMDMSDPDSFDEEAFDEVTASAAKRDAIAEAKARLQAKKSEDDEEEEA